ncbi:MAG: hypothetical protein R3E48_22040 [Burkholderiaceae bacterium]
MFCRKEDLTLTQTSAWDSMGMRGTCSPGFQLVCDADERQILPAAYADISDQSMVPYSHILWSAVLDRHRRRRSHRGWQLRAGQCASKSRHRATDGHRLCRDHRHAADRSSGWRAIAAEFDAIVAAVPELGVWPMGWPTIWALKMNNLKTAQSNLAPQVVHRVLRK